MNKPTDIYSKVALIIPMRIASTRLPGKQHELIGDRPLIYHALDHALKTNIKSIYIACDDIKHFDLINNYDQTNQGQKIEPIMTSLSHSSGSDRIFEAAQILADRGEEFEFIINLQGDMPFFEPEIVTKSLDLMNVNPDFDITTCAVRSYDLNLINLPSNPAVVIAKNGRALYFSRATIPYNAPDALLHIGVYVYKMEALKKFVHLEQTSLEQIEKLEQLRAIENNMNIGVSIVNSFPISVDTMEDLVNARNYYQQLQKSV
ncbi:MAG: 3-deoxy-manno-octulosonate cytidylyltransferase [Alphaproteobacteria bacterium]|nr:3-deoxy-manno-octulosonate cytidylyltransferase [Alphaproteobacteria bacterium]